LPEAVSIGYERQGWIYPSEMLETSVYARLGSWTMARRDPFGFFHNVINLLPELNSFAMQAGNPRKMQES
jgi:hypothetical protein